MGETALQRKNMVEGQVRPSDVTDRRITAAMSTVPRECFVPPEWQKFAYSDETLMIAPGRFLLAPAALAKLIQTAEIDKGERVLVIGGCAGYAAALISQFTPNVIALLPDEAALRETNEALATAGIGNVTVVVGPLASGDTAHAPYDAIVIEGGFEDVPEALSAQLAPSGRLVGIEVGHGVGRAFVLQKTDRAFARRDVFQAAAPLLPGFEALKPEFVF
ncbi:protein-L-isoaspartate O-methyltransferase [Hyphomicrobium methylovorum]|uniref:protein-L-isoaspartate O-methyltransferase family protein n=1 Tax=Hyphomicrobium methylovorum TaxID=84 RepID=UPI0015E7AF4B|nr:protein-L-isoaspartate O-methyltransferase [Hyphomicrobium methylovorum]MBA2127516.1 protein-L-isoaspartate O-methyltransferase [Hyphomicrobium methylovorum]